MKKRSIAVLVLTTSLVFAGSAFAQAKLDKVVKVGSLGDQSGLYADIGERIRHLVKDRQHAVGFHGSGRDRHFQIERSISDTERDAACYPFVLRHLF